MPVDQLCMSLMAILMLVAAVMGTNVMAGPFGPLDHSGTISRNDSFQTPERSEIVDCEIVKVDVKERELTALVEGVKTKFKVTASVQVTKDKREVKFGSLAEGDYAVLTLATGGSKLVTRIEAVSSR